MREYLNIFICEFPFYIYIYFAIMIHFLKFKVQVFKYTYIFDLYTRNSRKNLKYTIFLTNLQCMKNVH